MNSTLRLLPTAPRPTSSIVAQASATLASPPQQNLSKADKITKGTVSYYLPPPSGEEPYVYVYKRDNNEPQVNFGRIEKEIDLHDLRDKNFSLKENGVELHKLKVPSDINWDDREEVWLLHSITSLLGMLPSRGPVPPFL